LTVVDNLLGCHLTTKWENVMTTEYAVGQHDQRPWGRWEVVAVGPGYAVKRIVVKPGHRLSLQRHQFRAEHWFVVAGIGQATRNGEIITLARGQHAMIGMTDVHRMTNPGSTDLIFIEVQHGGILDENDIERLEDDYGRYAEAQPRTKRMASA